MSMVDAIYQAIILLLSPVAAFIFIFFRRGRARLGERFGCWEARSSKSDAVLWFHAASNGEVRGLLPLLRRIRSDYPAQPILLTATSVSAFELLQGMNIEYHLAPFDSFPLYQNALDSRDVRALIVAETEIWPGMFSYARNRRIPVIAVNARISDYTVRAYRLLRPLLKTAVNALRRVCCSDASSVERFKMIGAAQVELTGNMKYDSAPSLTNDAQIHQLRKRFPLRDERIVVLGSLRPGEEDVWLKALAEGSRSGKAVGCILAPRHLEKVDYFIQRVRQSGLSVIRFSECESRSAEGPWNVILLDVFGMLEGCYSLATLAFIGASLVDIGGHNPLEASAYGTVVAMGPYDSTVKEITAQLEAADALIRIAPGQDLSALIEAVATGDAALKAKGMRAQAVWQANRGATERVIAALIEEHVLALPGETNAK